MCFIYGVVLLGSQMPGAASSEDILNQGPDDGASSSEIRGQRPQSPTPTTLVQVPVHLKKGINTKYVSVLIISRCI